MQGCESCISNLSTKPFIDCLLLSGGFDSEGTARLVVASLKKTLGMTEEDLQEKLESFSSDGVYMSKKHRARGGGFLSLHTHLEKLLDIAPDTISDNYDGGHVLQLSLSDTFKKGTNKDSNGDNEDEVDDGVRDFSNQ